MARVSSRFVVVTLVGVLFPRIEGTALAQMTGEQAVQAADASKLSLPPDMLSGEGLFGRIGEDYFFTLAMRINFDREDWGVGFQLPLRLRVIDNDPKKTNDDYFGVLRREDWDEWQKFLRVIRYVYVGRADKKGPFYVRIGELQGLTVGHGTIMYRYFNGIDLDRWHTGVNAAVNVGAFGGEAMIGDVTDPYLGGLRFTVRPLELAMGEGWLWDKLVLGTTLIADLHAPASLQKGMVDAMGRDTVAIDSHNHPIVASDKTLAIYGLDVGLEVFSNELLSITPYIDFNKMNLVQNGWGLHMGILWQARLPMVIDTLTLDARTEYRRVSRDYIGPYFNTTYEIERYTTLGSPVANGTGLIMNASTLPFTKLETITSTRAGAQGLGGGRNGVFFDLLAGFPQFAYVGGEYIAYDSNSQDGSLRLSLEVPALKVVRFSAFYYRINVAGLSDLFKLDDKSAIVASASIPLYSVFSLNLRWWRVWRLDPASGAYNTADDWSVGVGFSLQL